MHVRKYNVPIVAAAHTEIEVLYPSSVLRSVPSPPPEEMTLIFDISPNYGAGGPTDERTLLPSLSRSHFKATLFTVAICNPYTHSIRPLEHI